jgi:hypothetical protein
MHRNCVGGSYLQEETFAVVANFTLIWNIFEDTACGTHACVQTFELLAEGLARDLTALPEIDKALAFWSRRYWTGSEFNSRFASLCFRGNDRRTLVEGVLKGEKHDLFSKTLAVMIIAYRLRNNLFHGIKAVATLNQQTSNLDTATRALSAILETGIRHPVRRRRVPNPSFTPTTSGRR